MQAIGRGPSTDLLVLEVDTTELPPPPPPPPEPEPEPKLEEPPPELVEQAQPLDLAQLELALSPSVGGGWMSADFSLDLNHLGADQGAVQDLIDLADLDQKPRAIYQSQPAMNANVRAKAPGTVAVIFMVGTDGRVEQPRIQSSDDPVFERPALEAVETWRFEPGQKNGEPVRFRMRVEIKF
jgi:protein TonB